MATIYDIDTLKRMNKYLSERVTYLETALRQTIKTIERVASPLDADATRALVLAREIMKGNQEAREFLCEHNQIAIQYPQEAGGMPYWYCPDCDKKEPCESDDFVDV